MNSPVQPNGKWQQSQNTNRHPYIAHDQNQRQMLVTVDFGAFASKLTPQVATLSTVVLGILTVVSYMMKWRSSENSSYSGYGPDLSVNGFGLWKAGAGARGLDVAVHDLDAVAFFVALVVIFLFLASTVLLKFTNARKTAALLLTIAGGITTLYCFIGLFSDLGITNIVVGDYGIKSGVSFGIFLALLVGLVTLALGVLTLLTTSGSLLPAGRFDRSAPGTSVYLRPTIVAATTAGFLVLLVISYCLIWRRDDNYSDDMAINGLTVRKGMSSQLGLSSDVSVLSLWPAALIFLSVAVGALLLAATTFRCLGTVLILLAGTLSFINTLYAIFTDFGLYGTLGDLASTFGADNDSSPAIGAFLAALISIALITISVIYLFQGTGASPRSHSRSSTEQVIQPGQPYLQDNADLSTAHYRQEPRRSQQDQIPSKINGLQDPPAGPVQDRWS